MLLCASSQDNKEVEVNFIKIQIIEAPSEAVPGERIFVDKIENKDFPEEIDLSKDGNSWNIIEAVFYR